MGGGAWPFLVGVICLRFCDTFNIAVTRVTLMTALLESIDHA